MKNKLFLGTVLASLLTGGLAVASPGYTAPTATRMIAFEGRWTSLGHAFLGGRFGAFNNRQTIELGRHAPRLSSLRLVVKQGDPVLRAVRVTFGNGEIYTADLRLRHARFPAFPGRAHDGAMRIDLPGHARMVRSIEIIAAPGARRDRAVVEVLGERAPPAMRPFFR
jgi:hypothetical protein